MYDRQTVERVLALSREGHIDREISRICDIPMSTIGHWRRGERRRSPDPANPVTHDRRFKRDCPRCFDRELPLAAYAYLLGLYLGDGHITHARRGVLRLAIYCCDGWPGLMDAAEAALAAVMPGSIVGRRQRRGCTAVGSTSKHWACLFPQHGPGPKHKRKIALEAWQQEIVAEFSEEFIRGLIHSDGCRGINRVRRPGKDGDRWYEYPRYFFSNASDDIRDLFTEALDRLGIAWKQANTRIISVARKEAVARLDEFVGPRY